MPSAHAFMPLLRPLTLADLPAVVALQSVCYSASFHEPLASFAAKREASPSTCWAVHDAHGLAAYAVALPVDWDSFPALNAQDCPAPLQPQLLYLHDMAVHPRARSMGLGRRLVDQVLEAARGLRLCRIGLVAVQDSSPYWARLGFGLARPQGGLAAKIASFGPDARFMDQPVAPA